MSYHIYQKRLITELAAKIKEEGYQVYISKSGTYGFYTDGRCVVSFQTAFSSISFSGNYTPVNSIDGRSCGTGWELKDGYTFGNMLGSYPPPWAVGDIKVTMTNPRQYLKFYKSSGYVEVKEVKVV